jgi:hypothetical protein
MNEAMDWPAWIGAVGGLIGGISAGYVLLQRRSIERYVHELDRVSYEHEVVFSRLHERRVDVIADLYAKLIDAQRAFGTWTHPLQASNEDQKQKGQAAFEAGKGFEETFVHNRIWLDEDLCAQLDRFNRTLYEAFVDFTTFDADDPRTKSDHLHQWQAVIKRLEDEVQPLRVAVEKRFREMLGSATERHATGNAG